MGIVQIIGILTLLSIALLCFGYYGLLKKKYALIGTVVSIILGCGLLLLAVLPNNSIYGSVLYQGSGKEKVVALTFDDGPYPPYTQEVLEVLRQKNVQATFFLVGENAVSHPETAHAIAAAGHLVGTHAYQHMDLLRLDAAQLQSQLQKGQEAVAKTTGKSVTFFRPPHGFKDWRIMTCAEKLGLTVVNWSVIAKDWLNPGVDVIVNRVADSVQPGSIILLHDGDSSGNKNSREQTVAALPLIIDKLRAQGYSFVTVEQIRQ